MAMSKWASKGPADYAREQFQWRAELVRDLYRRWPTIEVLKDWGERWAPRLRELGLDDRLGGG